MTNEEKAKERAMQVFPCPNEDEQRRIVELAYNDACQWKDNQFKEYLEKKKAEYTRKANMRERTIFDYGYECAITEIINELFKEK